MFAALWTGAAGAETVRVATFHTDLSARGPGLLLAEIEEGSPRVDAVVAMIAETDPDILVLQDIDYDAGGATLAALAGRLAEAGADYPERFALRPNAGMATEFDLDGNGRRGEPRDAQGYGRFAGDGGMAVLSKRPIRDAGARDLSALIWAELPGADLPPMAPEPRRAQRLSSVAHWIVPIDLGATDLTLMTWHATPPVFDGPEDRNGRRNRDETLVWTHLLDGALDIPPPDPPFVILGVANVDPVDGEGRRDALAALLADPRLQDPRPRSDGGAMAPDAAQSGPPDLDTAAYSPRVGNLRVSYVLPSADLQVVDAGVLWPVPGTDLAHRLGPPEAWPAHRLVWVDLRLP